MAVRNILPRLCKPETEARMYDECSCCGGIVRMRQQKLTCRECGLLFHRTCTSMRQEDFRLLKRGDGLEGWLCQVCSQDEEVDPPDVEPDPPDVESDPPDVEPDPPDLQEIPQDTIPASSSVVPVLVPCPQSARVLELSHLTNRVQVGSPVTMKLTRVPPFIIRDEEPQKPTFEKQPLKWEQDAQLYSHLLDRKIQEYLILQCWPNESIFKFNLLETLSTADFSKLKPFEPGQRELGSMGLQSFFKNFQ